MYAIWGYSYVLYAAAATQIYSAKTKYINIVMHITMPIPPRVVMTEIYFWFY